jgi:hypothetical protein
MKIRLLEAELLHADGQTTDMTKITVAFRNFATSTKKVQNTWEVNCNNEFHKKGKLRSHFDIKGISHKDLGF